MKTRTAGNDYIRTYAIILLYVNAVIVLYEYVISFFFFFLNAQTLRDGK